VAGNNVVTFIRRRCRVCQQAVFITVPIRTVLHLRRSHAPPRLTVSGPAISGRLQKHGGQGMKTFSDDSARCGATSKV
jgi:hypothetical protein